MGTKGGVSVGCKRIRHVPRLSGMFSVCFRASSASRTAASAVITSPSRCFTWVSDCTNSIGAKVPSSARSLFSARKLAARLSASRLTPRSSMRNTSSQYPNCTAKTVSRIVCSSLCRAISSAFCACRMTAVLNSMPKFLSNGWEKVSCSVP